MIYRARLDEAVLHRIGGIPSMALDALAETLGAVVEDPYDALNSLPAGSDPRERCAMLGTAGWVEFQVDDEAAMVTIVDVVWVG